MSRSRVLFTGPVEVLTKEQMVKQADAEWAERQAHCKKIADAQAKRDAARIAARESKIDRIAQLLKISAQDAEELVTILNINWF